VFRRKLGRNFPVLAYSGKWRFQPMAWDKGDV
jgi:hypothetical protein